MSSTGISLRKRIGLEIQRKFQNDLIETHPLYQLFWECTLRCNLHCRHCGSDCKTDTRLKDMPGEDFLRVLDSVRTKQNPHEVFVIITGGEPLMRSDLEKWGRAIYDKGFPWGLVTNGRLLTAERFRSLLAAGLHSVAISLDGLQENHNWMRGDERSFETVSKAIDLMAAEQSIIFDVVTCVTEHNFDELPAIRDFLIGKGVKRWRLLTVFPVGRAADDPELQLSNRHFRELMDFIRQTKREGRIRADFGCEGFLGNYEFDVRDDSFFCKAGVTVGSVLSDGSISACSSIRSDYHQGNIYKDDFMEVWENRFQVFRNKEWARKGECADCKVFRYCRGNGMHLRDGDGNLLMCHMKKLRDE
ncbi:TIGR04133 family radical SAM/SPASM protein [Prevotella sp. Rep29]|uniref:TIGR04133 family radical SAM/SPASM protein n=1 Tax=Prevotella sp. Rep29 TaxID=2691580 RepID=UPI001C6DEE96|nr:TIGR04133 family radical SAM/SPASM protein [Prevotella sp. Rep29]QYR10069.1 radical SAM protein [Prevotella sp. Rep29]